MRSAPTTRAWRSNSSPPARNRQHAGSFGVEATLDGHVKHLLSIVALLGLVAAATFAGGALAAPAGCAPGGPKAGRAAVTPQKQVAKTGRQSHKTAAKPAREKVVVTLPSSVRIAGVRVGRLVPAHAEKVVQRAFDRPLTVQID